MLEFARLVNTEELAIESNWDQLKTKILRQMHGTKEHLIPGHLAEYW